MRTGKNGYYLFGCDKCKCIAGAHPDEYIALARAKDVSRVMDWEGSFEKGAKIYCHYCKGENND